MIATPTFAIASSTPTKRASSTTPSLPAPRSTACRLSDQSIFDLYTKQLITLEEALLRALTRTNSAFAFRVFAPRPTPPARKWPIKWPTSNVQPQITGERFAPRDPDGFCQPADQSAHGQSRKNFSLRVHPPIYRGNSVSSGSPTRPAKRKQHFSSAARPRPAPLSLSFPSINTKRRLPASYIQEEPHTT